jgi:rRNA biogenesis protein RRP5
VVDPDRKRVALTAKKALVDSDLPIISRLEDAQVGTVTHAVVFKVLDKAILVEFYNNLRAQVPLRETRYVFLTSILILFVIYT